jgi:hypothetical protein
LRPSALRKVKNGSLRILPFEEIDKKIKAGEYQYHDFQTFGVLTQVTDYGTEKVLDVVLLLGDGFLEKKSEVVAHLVSFGKEHGCKAVEALSRLGLEPTLKPLGFRRTKILLRREI